MIREVGVADLEGASSMDRVLPPQLGDPSWRANRWQTGAQGVGKVVNQRPAVEERKHTLVKADRGV